MVGLPHWGGGTWPTGQEHASWLKDGRRFKLGVRILHLLILAAMIPTQARIIGYLNLFILLLILFVALNPTVLVIFIGGVGLGIIFLGLIVWGLVNFIRFRKTQEASKWDSALLLLPVINFVVIVALISVAVGME